MIRFCDKDVCCISNEQSDRSALLDYFFQGNMDEVVCVQNPDGTYRGWISYYSLIHSEHVAEAVLEEYVKFDNQIWENARKFFACHEYRFRENALLPVADQAGNLICFAYEDGEANREIRMLRELEELDGASGFADCYPQYSCVKICGCNELAVLFAGYLKKQGIAVKTEGELWKYFLPSDSREYPDHRCLTIYAEGAGNKKSRNWVENLLRSVSPEFECVDCIYEANLKKGLVVNAMGSFGEWIRLLKNTDKDIVIWGTGTDAQNVYDLLLRYGVECSCFLCDSYEDHRRFLFGKKIITPLEMKKRSGSIVMLDCCCKYSAWGTDAIDYYDYLGCYRNKDLFAVRDYLEIPHDNLKTVLKGCSLLFAGDKSLCEKAAGYLKDTAGAGELIYADVLGENTRDVYANQICAQMELEDVRAGLLCLIIMPDLYTEKETAVAEKKREIIRRLEERGIWNYTDYFSRLQSFLTIEKETGQKCMDRHLTPKKMILGAIGNSCGNTFIKELLDNHPSVLMISDFGFFNNNLFWICMKLEGLAGGDLVDAFENVSRAEYPLALKDEPAFKETMRRLLEPGKRYGSLELFVIFMISYVSMYGRKIKDVSEMVVFWEPHFISRDYVGDLVQWLKLAGSCGILNVVRNICMVKGSGAKIIFGGSYKRTDRALEVLLKCQVIWKKDAAACERYEFRFEDIKLHPREELSKLCHVWGIPWSETLMETTQYGQKAGYLFRNPFARQSETGTSGIIADFDLQPVYNQYEAYFSEYDRFRISLANAPYQKKYGYPYVGLSGFTRRELQEMFIKKFRMEAEISFHGVRDELEYRIENQKKIRCMLWELRKIEFMEEDAGSGEI